MSPQGEPRDPDLDPDRDPDPASGGATAAERSPAPSKPIGPPVSRREVLIGGAALAAATAAGCASHPPASASRHPGSPATGPAAVASGAGGTVGPGAAPITLNLNGKDHALAVDPRTTLLDALRERLAMTGTKKGCDHGQCGACTVLIDGRRTLSCLTLALSVRGQKVTTIEGLAQGDDLHPMQAAFIKHDAFQCGYCTPGQICSAVALVHEGHARSDDDIRELMSGNLCRCGAYPNIVAAVREVLAQKA